MTPTMVLQRATDDPGVPETLQDKLTAHVRENSAWRGLGIEYRSDNEYSIAQFSSD